MQDIRALTRGPAEHAPPHSEPAGAVLHRILGELGHGFARVSAAGTILEADPGLCALTGHEPEALIGAHLSTLAPDVYGELISQVSEGHPARLRTTFARKDGGDAYVGVDAALAGSGNVPDDLVLIVRDISSEVAERRRQAVTEARLREARLAARLITWEWDVQSDRITFSHELLEPGAVDGGETYSLEDALKVIDARERAAMRHLFGDLAAGRRASIVSSYRLDVPEQGEIWVETRAGVVDLDGDVVRTVWGTTQDVTAQRTAQQHREEAEEFWQATLDSLAQHVCVLDETGVILAVNQAWRDFAAANGGADVGVGHNYFEVCERAAVTEPAAALVIDALQAVASGDWKDVSVEYPCHSPDERRWFVLTANRYRGSGATRVVVQHENVTERKRAEDAGHDSERRLREAQRVAQIGSFEIDGASRSVRLSDEMYVLYGVDPGAFDGDLAKVASTLPPEDRARFEGLVERVLSRGEEASIEHCFAPHRGPRRWAETRVEPVRGPDGTITGARGTSQEITARKRAQEEVELQAGLLDSVDASVVAADLGGRITHWTQGAVKLYGWSSREAVGRLVTDVLVALDRDEPDRDYWHEIIRAGHAEGEFLIRRKDESAVRVYARITVLKNDSGAPYGVVGVSVDMTERAEAEQRLRAARDYLSAVTGSMGEGLFTLDADGLLTYMNAAAEQALGWTTAELSGRHMHSVIHSRRADGSSYPAEECPIQRTREHGEDVRIDDDVFIQRDGSPVPVAYTATPFETEAGVRGSAVVFRDISKQKEEEARVAVQLEAITMVGQIRRAISADRLVLYAQPIIEISTGKTVQHELLIRMIDDDGALIAPCSFLPAAERYGLIAEIDRWVLGRAVEMAAEGKHVEMNLSGETLSEPDLAALVESELERAGAEPGRLVFELTETAVLRDEATARAFIDHVAALGCGLALDDFGTGYGGFTYLKHLPVDFLKIDVEFVRDLTSNSPSQHVVQAVVALARGFGLKTVAEGVEDESVLELLRDYGVDYAQGFAIARPAPAEEVFAAA